MVLRFVVLWIMISATSFIAHAGAFEDGMAAFEAREYQKALALWRRLAEQGDVVAQIHVGDMYAKSLGVTQDITEALIWFNKAIAQGSTEAEFRLGEIYESGQGNRPVDYEQAIKWYRKAAERGHAGAQYSLGVRYFKGEGVPTDYAMAYAWMAAAAKQDFKSSASYRDLIASVLDSDELKKAEALATQLPITTIGSDSE